MPVRASAVIVPVTEVEPLVEEFRAQLDPTAAWGVPAHVTVLVPFLPPDRVGPGELRALGAAVRSVPRFEVTFRRVEWFRADVLWLAPEPDDAFRALTTAVCSAFPGYLPYDGAFAEVVPHLTIAAQAELDCMRDAARTMMARLPVSAAVRAAHLYQGHDAPMAWRSVAEFPLGAGS